MLCRYYGLYQPPFERKVLNRAQSRAFSMDGPVGSPWGGPAYGEYVEIVWHTNDSAVYIEYIPATTAPIRPAAPSVIATVSFVSALP